MSDTALLQQILARLDSLPAEVAAAIALRTATPADNAAAPPLLHAMEETCGAHGFTVNELLVHAEVVAGRAADPRLHIAIVRAVGGLNGRKLGRLLSRIANQTFDGLRLTRVGTGREGVVWRVSRVSKPACTVSPSPVALETKRLETAKGD